VKASDIVVTAQGARFMNRRFPCAIGRGGITDTKREGDGATPRGIHKIVGMLYRPDRLSPAQLPDWALPIGPGDLWSDDVTDPDYNLMVRRPHAFGHERLTRPDPLYDLILITGWNWPHAVPGRGSAIFIHTWRRPRTPTAGCVAFARADILWIANRIRHETRLIIR
jgi:L,D-peptidoglycan transpeptidase YkuD (ErfK/YbiS/YcfS/YnhG family)